MDLLRILPNSRRAPYGLEWVILKKLPMVLLGGALIPLFFSALSHAFPPEGAPMIVARHMTSLDIFAIASALTVWMTVLTVAIGCFIVVVMKGPAYVADAYPLPDSEHPEDARNLRRM